MIQFSRIVSDYGDREHRGLARYQRTEATASNLRRKIRGSAYVELVTGEIRFAELHWYEAHGIGKKQFNQTITGLKDGIWGLRFVWTTKDTKRLWSYARSIRCHPLKATTLKA